MEKSLDARKRVIVVGAGPCGLPALKEMLAGGHDATTFEKASSLGGVFSSSAIYHDLHLTLSNWAMAFSDFPNKDLQCYPTGEEYLQYLKDYTSHFDLDRHIRYNTEVINASLDEKGKWVLQVQEGTQRRVEYADALVVATGAHQIPKPLPAQLSQFEGRIVHSSNYDDAFRNEVKEKQLRILVVGGGESGADLSADLGDLTGNTTVWLRRPNCFGPRFLISDSDEMSDIKDSKQKRYPVTTFLESSTTSRIGSAQNVFLYGIWRRVLWKAKIFNKKLSEACLDSTESAWVVNDQATYVTKNQRMCEAWGDDKIEVLITPEIKAQGQSVSFQMSDGRVQEREFDAIVLCTGYTAQFPWLKVEGFDANPRSWYLHCFPENLGNKLFFSGYARPHQGGIPPMAEIQSRYVTLILKGERKLPEDYVARAYRDKATEREYYFISPDLDSLVDWNAFLESVARRVGCEPRLPSLCVLAFNVHLLAVAALTLLAFAPSLSPINLQMAALLWTGTLISFFVLYDSVMIRWWFFPHWPIWYRQRGPDANPALVREVFSRTNIWRDIELSIGWVLFACWSWWSYCAQRVISLFFFLPHTIAKWSGIRFEWRVSDLVHP